MNPDTTTSQFSARLMQRDAEPNAAHAAEAAERYSIAAKHYQRADDRAAERKI